MLKNEAVTNLHCSTKHLQNNPSEGVMCELGRLLPVYCYNKLST